MGLENVVYANVTKMRYDSLLSLHLSSPLLMVSTQIPLAWNVKPTNKDTITNWKEKDEDVWIIQDDTEGTVRSLFLFRPFHN